MQFNLVAPANGHAIRPSNKYAFSVTGVLRCTFLIILFSLPSFSAWSSSEILPVSSISEASPYDITLGHPSGYVKTVVFKRADLEACDDDVSKYFHAFQKSYSYNYMLAWNSRIDFILDWKADEINTTAYFSTLYFFFGSNIRLSKIDGIAEEALRGFDTPCQVFAYSDGANQGHGDAMRDLFHIEVEKGVIK